MKRQLNDSDLLGPYTTPPPGRSGTFEAVDGASDRACRGATGGDLARQRWSCFLDGYVTCLYIMDVGLILQYMI